MKRCGCGKLAVADTPSHGPAETQVIGVHRVGCLKGKSKAKPKPGRFECEDCGAVVKSKKDACEPKKIKGGQKPARKEK